MLNSTVLDVAIGLTVVFLMLSAFCSLLNERIQSALDKRATMLEDAIRTLLDDPSTSLFDGVSQHALVRSIARSSSGMPPYIPSSTFTQALFDTLVPADGEHPLTFKRLRDAILRLPDTSTSRAALLTLTNSPEGNLVTARANVECWFDNAMEQLSGLYKRHVINWLFVLGFVMAAATNADSILLVQRLEHEGALRVAVAAHVDRVDTAGKQLSIDKEPFVAMDLLFWDTEHIATADKAASYPRAACQPELSLSWMQWLMFKILGCLMTALAVSLCAPLWFDLVSRLVNLRATGAKPIQSSCGLGAGGGT